MPGGAGFQENQQQSWEEGGTHPALQAIGPRQGAKPRAGWRHIFQTGFSQGLALLAL